MTLAEGIRKILESGILSECDVGETSGVYIERDRRGDGRSSLAGSRDDLRGVKRRVQALEYFSSQAGVWHPVRSELDW